MNTINKIDSLITVKNDTGCGDGAPYNYALPFSGDGMGGGIYGNVHTDGDDENLVYNQIACYMSKKYRNGYQYGNGDELYYGANDGDGRGNGY